MATSDKYTLMYPYKSCDCLKLHCNLLQSLQSNNINNNDKKSAPKLKKKKEKERKTGLTLYLIDAITEELDQYLKNTVFSKRSRQTR